jgi:hypothetical protein
MSYSDLYSLLYYVHNFIKVKHTILHFNSPTYTCTPSGTAQPPKKERGVEGPDALGLPAS